MFDKGSSRRNRRLFSFSDAGIAQPFMEVISMDKIKALNTKVMAKDFGIEEMDSRYGRINFYISPKRLYEETGYFWRGERR